MATTTARHYNRKMPNPVRLATVLAAILISACGSAGTANAPGPAPLANAGPDQAVLSGATVKLDGAASSDPAGLAVSFAWTQTAGPGVTLSDAAVAGPSFTAPVVPAAGPVIILVFSLTVRDANASSLPSIINITVNPKPPPNVRPVANPGINQAVDTAALVTLDGNGSFDPTGQAISFSWTQSSGPPVVLSSATAAQTSFTAPSIAAGQPLLTLSFSLVVTDAQASSEASSVTVTVNPPGTSFPPPPGTPLPAPPNPNPIANGGSGSARFEMGTGLAGIYIRDPAAGEDNILGGVIVTLGSIGGGGGSQVPPTDTTVTINGVPMLRDPNAADSSFILDPAQPQPKVGSGGQLILVAKATLTTVDSKGNVKLTPIERQLVLPCPSDIEVSSTPPIGSPISSLASFNVTSLSDITLNPGVVALSQTFPQAILLGYDRATRKLSPPSVAINLPPGPLDVNVPVSPSAGDAYLMQLQWPGIFILDGQSGGFCGLQKRWTYAK
jgi:K319-like protein